MFQRTLAAIARRCYLAFCLRSFAATAGAATPLHKVVFVVCRFQRAHRHIFVAKDMRFFEEQGLDAQIVWSVMAR